MSETPLPMPEDDKTAEDTAFMLDELSRQDEADALAEDGAIRDAKRRKINKSTVAMVAALILVPTAIIVGNDVDAFKWIGGEGDGVAKVGVVPEVDENDPKVISEAELAQVNFWQTEEGEINIPVKKTPVEMSIHGTYKDLPDEEQKALLRKAYSHTQIRTASGVMPSRAAGFTSEPSKSKLPDGRLNPVYSYIVAEDFQDAAFSFTERLINPNFGGWTENQYPKVFGSGPTLIDPSKFIDMFTSDYLRANQDKDASKWIPIYADVKGNNYGMGDKLLEAGPRWVGVVKSSKTKLTYNNKLLNYEADIISEIEYSAWAKDQTVLKKNATLTMHLVPNIRESGAEHKLLISSVSQKVN